MDLERFVKRFGFKVARVKYHNPYEYFDTYNGVKQAYYTKSSRDTTIEMEINQRELESMADYFIKTEKMLRDDHDEYRLRRDNPALEEAYSKYKMLLELYK
jgi:hypothetical protein